jgi:hypothetical protein
VCSAKWIALTALACAACGKSKVSAAPDAAPVVTASPVMAPSVAAIDASVAAFDASAAVKAVGPMRTLVVAELPKDLVVPGKVSKAVGWSDQNGENVVVFAIQWVDTMEDHDSLRNVYLTAAHVAYAQGVKKVLRTVKDSKESCDDYAMKAAFLDGALGVTDLDQDGFGELTFAYRISCEGHHTPLTLDLLMLENGDKYILRATSPSAYAIDSSFRAGPPRFLEHAEEAWRLTMGSR